MIAPPAGVKIWLVAGATDMRRGFDGLAALIAQQLSRDPFSGQMFVFRGRRGHLIKLLLRHVAGTGPAELLAYHAVPIVDLWRRALCRRSQKDRTTWLMVDKLPERGFPQPPITHPWPSRRFRDKQAGWEPYAGIPSVPSLCGGGAR